MFKEYYIRYLEQIRGISRSSIDKYIRALRTIERYLQDNNILKESMFDITEMDDLVKIKEYLENDVSFVVKDTNGHRMYSAALNNYLRFASGEGLENLQEKSIIFDIEVPRKNKLLNRVNAWRRSTIIKKQTIEMSSYQCILNPAHNTFISKSTMKPYMEGHHLVPMKLQTYFSNSLDIYANVVCLCPTCHRFLHYGLDEEKISLLQEIYEQRCIRLNNSGICLSKDEFIQKVV